MSNNVADSPGFQALLSVAEKGESSKGFKSPGQSPYLPSPLNGFSFFNTPSKTPPGLKNISFNSPVPKFSLPPPTSEQQQGEQRSLSSHNAARRQKLSPQVSPMRRELSSDSVAGGSSCHQCKSRRNFGDLTYCTSSLDKKKKNCRKKYCEHCLKKFYKEDPSTITSKKTWKCPSCRKLCCCAACRRKEQRLKAGSSPSFPAPSGNSQKLKKSSAAKKKLSKPTSSMMVASSALTQLKNSPALRPQSPNGSTPLPSPVLRGAKSALQEFAASQSPSTQGLNPYEYMSDKHHSDGAGFAVMMAVSQMPNVKKHIQYILTRKDLTDGQKVESIATLLRSTVAQGDGEKAVATT